MYMHLTLPLNGFGAVVGVRKCSIADEQHTLRSISCGVALPATVGQCRWACSDASGRGNDTLTTMIGMPSRLHVDVSCKPSQTCHVAQSQDSTMPVCGHSCWSHSQTSKGSTKAAAGPFSLGTFTCRHCCSLKPVDQRGPIYTLPTHAQAQNHWPSVGPAALCTKTPSANAQPACQPVGPYITTARAHTITGTACTHLHSAQDAETLHAVRSAGAVM